MRESLDIARRALSGALKDDAYYQRIDKALSARFPHIKRTMAHASHSPGTGQPMDISRGPHSSGVSGIYRRGA